MHSLDDETAKIGAFFIQCLNLRIDYTTGTNEFYVKKKSEVAQEAADEGRVISHEEAKKRLLAK